MKLKSFAFENEIYFENQIILEFHPPTEFARDTVLYIVVPSLSSEQNVIKPIKFMEVKFTFNHIQSFLIVVNTKITQGYARWNYDYWVFYMLGKQKILKPLIIVCKLWWSTMWILFHSWVVKDYFAVYQARALCSRLLKPWHSSELILATNFSFVFEWLLKLLLLLTWHWN